MPPIDEKQLLYELESLAQIEPSAEATARALSRTHSALNAAKSRRQHLFWRIVMPTSLAASIALIAAFLAFFAGPATPQAFGWEEVAAQVREAQTIRLEMSQHENGRVVSREIMYLRPPDLVRIEPLTPEGKPDLSDRIRIWRGHTFTSINPVTKLYQTKLDETGAEYESAFAILRLVGWPGTRQDSVQVKENKLSMNPAGQQLRDGKRFTAFRLIVEGPNRDPLDHLFLLIEPRKQHLRYIVTYNDQGEEEWVGKVELNPKVKDDLFETPFDGRDVSAPLRSRLPKDLLEVYDAYEQARNRFTPYRALIWGDGSGFPPYREVRDGPNWRLDNFNIAELFAERAQRLQPTEEFETNWKAHWMKLGKIQRPIDLTMMTYNGWVAHIGFRFGGDGPPVAATLGSRSRLLHRNLYEKRFMQFAWPQWMNDELQAPHGAQVNVPQLKWEKLPDDPQRPGLIGVRGKRDYHFEYQFEYWFDPQRDYLCVYREERMMKDSAEVRRITDFGRTPEGRWYPKSVVWTLHKIVDGKLGELTQQPHPFEIRVDTSQPVAPEYFDWPDGVPPPRKYGIEVMINDQVIQRLGREETHLRLSHLLLMLREYARKHDDQWPDDLATMLKFKSLPDEYLKNPRRPELSPGFVYHPPSIDGDHSRRLVIHEAYDKWPGELLVGYANGEIEMIGNEPHFKQLTKATKTAVK